MTRNQLEYRAQNEQKRANLAKEKLQQEANAETKRYNLVREGLDSQKLANDYIISQLNLTESQRANKARELETNRANLAREEETRRSNVASLDELSRHNKSTEGAAYANIALGRAQLQEQSRANMAREEEMHRSNIAQETERNRSNLAQEDLTAMAQKENKRHNVALEEISSARNTNEFNLGKSRLEADVALGTARVQNDSDRNIVSLFDTGVKAFRGISFGLN